MPCAPGSLLQSYCKQRPSQTAKGIQRPDLSDRGQSSVKERWELLIRVIRTRHTFLHLSQIMVDKGTAEHFRLSTV